MTNDLIDLPVTTHPDLAAQLRRLLAYSAVESPEFESRLQALERAHGAAVYSELILLLSHLRFEPEEAKAHWRKLMELRSLMEERLGAYVDPRVALVSYFVQVEKKIGNPVVVEMELFEKTRAFAYRDKLTGLRNYRYFIETLAQEILRSEQYGTPLSLVMIDIDDFKEYNDTHGHEMGNSALTVVAGLLREAARRVDVAVRYGGEEFALLAPSTPKKEVVILAERARQAIEKHSFPGEETLPRGKLTVSLGIATYPGDAADAAQLVRLADRAMYDSKASGKNLVTLYGQNRRSHQRVDIALRGSFSLHAAEENSLTTINISEGGMRFLADRHLPLGTLLDVRLQLPGSSDEITAAGRVVQSHEVEKGICDAAIRIVDTGARDQRMLRQFLRRLERPASKTEPGSA